MTNKQRLLLELLQDSIRQKDERIERLEEELKVLKEQLSCELSTGEISNED